MQKLGILLTSDKIPHFELLVVNQLRRLYPEAKFFGIKVNLIKSKGRQIPSLKKLFRYIKFVFNYSSFWFLQVFEKSFLQKDRNVQRIDKMEIFEEIFDDVININVTVNLNGRLAAIDESIHELKKLNLDLIYRTGGGIWTGKILTVSTYGILSFHHGDFRKYRGGPPGFWEVFYREPYTGITLQLLDETLDNGKILSVNFVRTQAYFVRNRSYLYLLSPEIIFLILQRIDWDNLLFFPNQFQSYKLFRQPTFFQQCVYGIKQLILFLRICFKMGKFKSPKWNIFFQEAEYTKVSNRKNIFNTFSNSIFNADPFICIKNHTPYLFFEKFQNGKGEIWCSQIKNGQIESSTLCLQESFHLSFPRVFCLSGNYYMIPESHEAKQIRLYRSTQFPLNWELDSILIEGIEYVDSIIYKWENKFFMRTSRSLFEGTKMFEVSETYLLNSSFPQNISLELVESVVDARYSRNGGLVESRDGDLEKFVIQKSGFLDYGSGISILTPEELNLAYYAHNTKLSTSPRPLRIHHLHSISGLTTWDMNHR